MLWKWITQLFKRDQSHAEQSGIAPPDDDIPKNVHASDKGASNQQQKFKQRLEVSFFNWLLNCDDPDLLSYPKELKKKERTILRAIDDNDLTIENLPRRPASFPLLIKLLNDESSSSHEISKILLTDPALTTQILKTVNSPFFKISEKAIDSVDQAVVIMGSRGIKNVVATTLMIPMIEGKSSKEAEFSKKVWEWGLLSASASDQFARLQSVEPGPLYLLGLIPSLTYLLIYRSLLNYQKETNLHSPIEPSIIKSIIQQRSWKLCHNICEQWKLPPSCEKYLTDAQHVTPDAKFNPLGDGIFVGSQETLKSLCLSPLNDQKKLELTCAPSSITKQVIQFLESRQIT